MTICRIIPNGKKIVQYIKNTLQVKKENEAINNQDVDQSPEADEQETLTLEEQLEEKEQELAELRDKYLRIHAEFDNFRKRTVKEKIEFMKTASQDTISELLPVLDDFDRAHKAALDSEKPEEFPEGVQLVFNKLKNALKGKGLEVMESTGEPFDPEFHEAITKIPASSEDQKGCVVDTIEKGYTLKGKIIRYAKVVVAE